MYFDGGTYYFGKNIDDATFIKVNGSQVLKDENWNKFVATNPIKLEPGWYDVEFRMGNGTGGAGCSNGTKGKDGNPLGLGYIHYAADAESTPAPAATTDLDFPVDSGDGSFFRIKVADTYAAFKTITKTESGYTVVVKSIAPSRMTMTAYLGTEDGTPQTEGVSVTLDPDEETTYELPWTEDTVPFILFKFESEPGEGVTRFWGDALPFKADNKFNSTVSVSAPASIYESDLAQQKFTVSRPQTDSWQEITVNLAYVGDKTDFSPLPDSVTLAVGESSKDVPFTMVDNDEASENRTFTIVIAEGDKYEASEDAGSASITVIDDETAADLCVWTGGGDSTSWEDADNWDGKKVPTVIDTAVFTDAAPANGGAVTISSAADVKILKFQRLAAMTLTGEGSLRLGGVTRDDLDGNEADQTISVPLKLYPTDGDNCVWDINGSGQLILAAASEKAVSTVYLYKTGAGKLRFSAENAANGILKVFEGDTVTAVANAVKSQVIVGGGDNPASFVADGGSVVNGLTPIAYTNGTIRINDDHASGGPDNFQAHEGGVVYYKSTYGGKYDLWGGTINIGYRGWTGTYGQHITAHQSDLTAVLTGNTVCSDYYEYPVKVENGAQPIDFIFNGAIDGGDTGHSFTVSGNGTMQTLAGWGTPRNISMSDITWLMDNVGKTQGSGSGNLTVGNSATLGGLGVWGGGAESQILKFQGSSGKVATLAPGSLTTDGDHVTGTYTVGSETVTNTLNMAAYSRMLVRVAEEKQDGKMTTIVDGLKVYGTMNVADANTAIAVELADPEQNIRDLKGGEFVIAEATDAINGMFADVQVPAGAKWKVRYEGKKIILSIPARGFAVIIK